MFYAIKNAWVIVLFEAAQNKQQDNRFIYMKITVDGKAVEVSTKRRCEQSRWNACRSTDNKSLMRNFERYLKSGPGYGIC